MEDCTRTTGRVRNSIAILDPDAVVIGGRLSNIKELYAVGVERARKCAFYDQTARGENGKG